jgi:hypothetical protein
MARTIRRQRNDHDQDDPRAFAGAQIPRRQAVSASGRHPLYQAALDADAQLSEAIVRAFGRRADRWNVRQDKQMADAGVRAAYLAKVGADRAWLDFMRAGANTMGGR